MNKITVIERLKMNIEFDMEYLADMYKTLQHQVGQLADGTYTDSALLDGTLKLIKDAETRINTNKFSLSCLEKLEEEAQGIVD